MSHRPLAIVSGLTIGDYLLWNWSLNHHHDVLALISGLTLPPLAIACLWLLALNLARLLARTTRRSRGGRPARGGPLAQPGAGRRMDRPPRAPGAVARIPVPPPRPPHRLLPQARRLRRP